MSFLLWLLYGSIGVNLLWIVNYAKNKKMIVDCFKGFMLGLALGPLVFAWVLGAIVREYK
jgi:hypothetical protein